MLGRREDWSRTKRPELIARTVFRCARVPAEVGLTHEYIVACGKDVADAMKARDAGENGDGDFLPSSWDWTKHSFTAKVRACVKPIYLHYARCIDVAELERVYFGAPGASADAPGERAVQVVARADVANEVSAPGAVYVSRDVELIRAARARSKRARKCRLRA